MQAGHSCGDDKDLINGLPTGSVRISFGYLSTLQDAQICLHFIVSCFLDGAKDTINFNSSQDTESFKAVSSEAQCDKSENSSTHGTFSGLQTPSTCDNSTCGLNHHATSVVSNVRDVNSVSQNLSPGVATIVGQGKSDIVEHKLNSCEFKLDEVGNNPATLRDADNIKTRRLTHMYLYPVKSCAAFKVSGILKLYNKSVSFNCA